MQIAGFITPSPTIETFLMPTPLSTHSSPILSSLSFIRACFKRFGFTSTLSNSSLSCLSPTTLNSPFILSLLQTLRCDTAKFPYVLPDPVIFCLFQTIGDNFEAVRTENPFLRGKLAQFSIAREEVFSKPVNYIPDDEHLWSRPFTYVEDDLVCVLTLPFLTCRRKERTAIYLYM